MKLTWRNRKSMQQGYEAKPARIRHSMASAFLRSSKPNKAGRRNKLAVFPEKLFSEKSVAKHAGHGRLALLFANEARPRRQSSEIGKITKPVAKISPTRLVSLFCWHCIPDVTDRLPQHSCLFSFLPFKSCSIPRTLLKGAGRENRGKICQLQIFL